MTVWGALAGGGVGGVVLTGGLRLGQELGLTRMDLPLLLGTTFTPNRDRAYPIGYLIHFVTGVAFGLAYAGVFEAVGRAGWEIGLGLGLVHAMLAGTLITLVLPFVNPRMGTPWTDAEETPILEPPGFLLLNYGRQTALVTLAGHLVYGTIVGAFAAGF